MQTSSRLDSSKLRESIERLKKNDRILNAIQRGIIFLPIGIQIPLAAVSGSAIPTTASVLGFMTNHSRFLLLGSSLINCICILGCCCYARSAASAHAQMERYFQQGLDLIDDIKNETEALRCQANQLRGASEVFVNRISELNGLVDKYKVNNSELKAQVSTLGQQIIEHSEQLKKYKDLIQSLTNSQEMMKNIVLSGAKNTEEFEGLLNNMHQHLEELKIIEQRLSESSRIALSSVKLQKSLENIESLAEGEWDPGDKEALQELLVLIKNLRTDTAHMLTRDATPESRDAADRDDIDHISVDSMSTTSSNAHAITEQPLRKASVFQQKVKVVQKALLFAAENKVQGNGNLAHASDVYDNPALEI